MFRPAVGEQVAPSGARARVGANLAALRVLGELEQTGQPASGEQQRALAAWSGWGAVPQLFDDAREEWAIR